MLLPTANTLLLLTMVVISIVCLPNRNGKWQQDICLKTLILTVVKKNGTTPIGCYAKTISACGAVDMWGNVWEWTSTAVGGKQAVKGGAWDSKRTDCRTESRGVGRTPQIGYDNVGFRVIREEK